ncbi:MAG: hypothetical protein DSM106950_02770 [Stigonema ocellatum SAG 48.90 = DSM 106950]|nr:hypothetical protein [Stigonema ocellatum SAG 48.90 = DSM 106950]
MTFGLTIGSLSVSFNQFTNYERILAETGQTEYAIAGTPLDSGSAYEPWKVSTLRVKHFLRFLQPSRT